MCVCVEIMLAKDLRKLWTRTRTWKTESGTPKAQSQTKSKFGVGALWTIPIWFHNNTLCSGRRAAAVGLNVALVIFFVYMYIFFCFVLFVKQKVKCICLILREAARGVEAIGTGQIIALSRFKRCHFLLSFNYSSSFICSNNYAICSGLLWRIASYLHLFPNSICC